MLLHLGGPPIKSRRKVHPTNHVSGIPEHFGNLKEASRLYRTVRIDAQKHSAAINDDLKDMIGLCAHGAVGQNLTPPSCHASDAVGSRRSEARPEHHTILSRHNAEPHE